MALFIRPCYLNTLTSTIKTPMKNRHIVQVQSSQLLPTLYSFWNTRLIYRQHSKPYLQSPYQTLPSIHTIISTNKYACSVGLVTFYKNSPARAKYQGLDDQPQEDDPCRQTTKQYTQESGGNSKHTTKIRYPAKRSNIKKEAVARHKTSNKVLTPLTIFRIIQYQEKRQKPISNSTDPTQIEVFLYH